MRYVSPQTEVTMIAMNATILIGSKQGMGATKGNLSLPLSEREFYLPENWENWI